MFRAASLVSSASVVTASKPRNEYAAIAAAAEMPTTVLLDPERFAVGGDRIADEEPDAVREEEQYQDGGDGE